MLNPLCGGDGAPPSRTEVDKVGDEAYDKVVGELITLSRALLGTLSETGMIDKVGDEAYDKVDAIIRASGVMGLTPESHQYKPYYYQ